MRTLDGLQCETRKVLLMKAERRHELHQNELAQWLGKAAKWAKAHSNHITAVVLVVAIAFFAWVLIAKHLRAREDAVAEKYSQAMLSASEDERVAMLKEVAEQDRNPFLAARASLDVGNLYAIKVLAEDKADGAQLKEWTEQATRFYTRASQMSSRHAGLESLAAQGYLGLGQLAAGARRFDDAEAMFKKALDMAPEGSLSQGYARMVLRDLPQIRTAPQKFAATGPAAEPLTPSDPFSDLLRGMQQDTKIQTDAPPFGGDTEPATTPPPSTETPEENPE